MSYMFEIYYRAPVNSFKETKLNARVSTLGGRLTFREDPNGHADRVVLTYEFSDRQLAETAAVSLRQEGEHVEGPVEYES